MTQNELTIPRYQVIYDLQYDHVWGAILRPAHTFNTTCCELKKENYEEVFSGNNKYMRDMESANSVYILSLFMALQTSLTFAKVVLCVQTDS